MVGIIGNIVLVCISIIAHQSYAQGSIDISIRDMNGRKVTRVAVGQQFNLHVLMNDIDGSNARVTFDQSRTIPMRRTSVQMRSINGRASTTHVYTARIGTRGVYTIGPVFVDDGKARYESNQISVDVNDASQQSVDDKSEHASLRLISSKLTAYVGESISFKLRFYYPHDGIRAERLVQPSVADIHQSEIEGPFMASETINGVVHDYVEWRWDTIFQHTGTYTIPSYTMEYVDRAQQSSRFGLFSSLFNSFGTTQQASSNALQLNVVAVPSHSHAAEFVGSVYNFAALVDHTQTAVGQAIVLTLELITSHHAAALRPPLLEGLPRPFKYYQSKVDVVSSETATKTCFEYIVQPLESGEWEIPSQKYTYFDVRENAYRTFQTDPLYVSVAQGIYNYSDDESHVITNQQEVFSNVTEAIRPLHEIGPWSREQAAKIMPWWFFWILIASPLWCGIGIYITNRWYCYYERTQLERRAKHALSYARAEVKRVSRIGSVEEIPFIFKQFYADKWRVPLHEITEQYMQDQFKLKNISLAMQQEWDIFWGSVMRYAFAQEKIADTLISELYREVEQWLDRLNALL